MSKDLVTKEQIAVHGEDTVITSLENLTKNHISSIETLNEDIHKTSQMLEDALMSDATYQENFRLAKEANKVKLATKSQIMRQPQNIILANKLKSMKQEKRDKKFALSDYLLEYERMAGVNQLELFDGEIVTIVKSAKVVKVRSKK